MTLAASLGLALAGSAWAQTAPPATSPATAPAPPPAAETKPAEEAKGPNTGRVSISAGVDWTSAYFFRGIKQETEDVILQPYGELSIKLVDQAGALTALSVTGGFWNSLHTGPTGSDSVTASDPKIWYEFDGYVRLSAVLWEDLTTYALYTAYTSPNDLFGTVQELAFGVAYNDAKLLGPFALNPTFSDRLRARRPGRRRRRPGRVRPDRHRPRLHLLRRVRVSRWPSPSPWRSA